jgi:2-octaprenyl-6-methoxyphenol hydroxylase
VPLPGLRSSVVWIASSARAKELHALPDSDLGAAIERQSHSILGRMSIEEGRNLFALSHEKPDKIAQNRIALVGESAHVFPPIGAQGLNLGLRDASTVADIVSRARELGEDVGSPDVMQRYDDGRRSDIASRDLFIDIANRALLSDFLPVQALRAAGMDLVNRVPPLRRLVMRQGLSLAQRPD